MEIIQLKPRHFLFLRFPAAMVCLLIIGFMISGCHSGNKNADGKEATNDEEVQQEEKTTPAFYKYFQGKIGERKAVLQLIKSYDRYDGILIDSLGKPLPVSGYKDSSNQLMLISYYQYNPVDTFSGTFPQPGVFQGFWSDTSGRSGPFVFQEMYPGGTYRWHVYTLKDSLAFDSSKQSPKAMLQMSMLWPDKKSFQPEAWSFITDTIVKNYLNKDTTIGNAETVLRSAADSFFYVYGQLRKDFSKDSKQGIGASFNWESDADMALLWNADSIISLAFKSYQYTGGAHGLGNTFLAVFDLKQNKILRINDIFKPGYQLKLRNILENKLRQQYDIPPNAPLNGQKGILFDKHLAITKNFYLTRLGIGFIYNPYEVAPYVVGQIELYVPFSEIKDILKYQR